MKTDETRPEYNVEKARRDNAILKKYAAIQKASEDKIGCQKIYVDMVDDIPAALVLDEIIFFTLPRSSTGKSALRVRKNGYLWMAVRRAEWWERKRLKERESDLAIAKLEKLDLIVKSVHRFNSLPTIHLRLNVDKFFQLYFDILERDNPPESENDTDLSGISDLYEMMGIPFSPNGELPNGEGNSPNGDDSSPNGDFTNSPDQPPHNPIGAFAPNDLPLDWKIAQGQEITENDLKLETDRKMSDAANLIATGFGINSSAAYNLSYAFMVARQIVIPDGKIKGQRKAVKEMLEMKVSPANVVQAVKDLTAKKMTVTDLFSVSKTAIDLANPAPPQNTTEPPPRQFPTFIDGRAVLPGGSE